MHGGHDAARWFVRADAEFDTAFFAHGLSQVVVYVGANAGQYTCGEIYIRWRRRVSDPLMGRRRGFSGKPFDAAFRENRRAVTRIRLAEANGIHG